MRKTLLVLCFVLAGSSIATAKSDVTKEQFFEVIGNQIKSILTESSLEKASSRGVPSVNLGYNISIQGLTHYWGNLSKDIMQNSYGVGKIKYEFSDLSSGFQNVLADIIKYHTHKQFCLLYNPDAKICTKPIDESLLILSNADKVSQIEGSEYPQLLAFYKEYAAFVEGIVKERMTKLKPSKDVIVVDQKTTASGVIKPPPTKSDVEVRDPKPLGYELFIWETAGFKSIEEVYRWIDAGFNDLNTIKVFKKTGFNDPEKAMAWFKAGFNTRPLIAFAYEAQKVGFTISEATEWKKAGLINNDVKDIVRWKNAGISAREAKEWDDNGFGISRETPSEWRDNGFTPQVAYQWKRQDIQARQAIEFRKRGIKPDDKDRIEWEKRTASLDASEKASWEKTGYSFPYMMQLMNYKITLKDLPLLKRNCPNEIDFGRMGYFGIKDPFEVEGKCFYYMGQKHQQSRGSEAIFRTGDQRKYYHVHLVLNGKVPNYIQGIVKGLAPVEMNSSSGRNMIPSGQVVFIKLQK